MQRNLNTKDRIGVLMAHVLHGVTRGLQHTAVAHYFLFQQSELQTILEKKLAAVFLIFPKVTAIHYKPSSSSTCQTEYSAPCSRKDTRF